jgi:hypothetical protein
MGIEELEEREPREAARVRARDRKRNTEMVVDGASVKQLVRAATKPRRRKKKGGPPPTRQAS